MKWLIVLFSIFKPFFSTGSHDELSNPVAELKEMIRANAAKVLFSFAVTSALATIFAAGVVMIAVNISTQYDVKGNIQWSTMMLAGFILILVPMITGSWTMMKYDQTIQIKKREAPSTVGTAHPLQDALALLIHDFVKEREMKRAQFEADSHHPVRSNEKSPPSADLRH